MTIVRVSECEPDLPSSLPLLLREFPILSQRIADFLQPFCARLDRRLVLYCRYRLELTLMLGLRALPQDRMMGSFGVQAERVGDGIDNKALYAVGCMSAEAFARARERLERRKVTED